MLGKETPFRQWRLSLSYRIALNATLRRSMRFITVSGRRQGFLAHLASVLPAQCQKSPNSVPKHAKLLECQDPWETRRNSQFQSRVSQFKSRERLKKSTDGRVQNFLRMQKKQHDMQVLANRGLRVSEPVNLSKHNLGNHLFISDKYLRDLDADKNQFSPPPPPGLLHIKVGGHAMSCVMIPFKRGKPKGNQSLETIFSKATLMVQQSFAEKSIEMDLMFGYAEDDFTVDVIVDPSSGHVLGAIEYVFMRRYLWLECLAVAKDYRNYGFGRLLIERLISVATARRKDILMYALLDVVPFYQRFGFQLFSNCIFIN